MRKPKGGASMNRPTPDPSQEGSRRSSAPSLSLRVAGVVVDADLAFAVVGYPGSTGEYVFRDDSPANRFTEFDPGLIFLEIRSRAPAGFRFRRATQAVLPSSGPIAQTC